VLKNYTLLNTNKIICHITHFSIWIYIWTCRISHDSKTTATLTTHYTPYDKEHRHFSSCTSHTVASHDDDYEIVTNKWVTHSKFYSILLHANFTCYIHTYIQDGSRIRTLNSGDQIEIQSFLLKLVYKQFIRSFQCLLLLMCMLFIYSIMYIFPIY